MDPRFNDIFDSVENEIFKVVFFPDRIYHARLPQRHAQPPLSLQRASRCANAFDIIVLKGEVYLDGLFLSNVLRIEYRAARLTEVARERSRFLRDKVRTTIKLAIRLGRPTTVCAPARRR